MAGRDKPRGRALITGGAQRLGAAMGEALVQAGYDLVIHYNRSDDAAEALAERLRETGRRVETVQGNLLDREAMMKIVPSAREAIDGPLTLLINNASIFERETLASASFESWDRHLKTNLEAPFFLAQSFAAQAAQDGADDDQIINMIDQRIKRLTPNYASYTLAKSALFTFTITAAMALAPDIRVNAIGPGTTLQGLHQTEASFQSRREASILGHSSDPGDIVAAMMYFLTAKNVTGQMLAVDGGQHLIWQVADGG